MLFGVSKASAGFATMARRAESRLAAQYHAAGIFECLMPSRLCRATQAWAWTHLSLAVISSDLLCWLLGQCCSDRLLLRNSLRRKVLRTGMGMRSPRAPMNTTPVQGTKPFAA